MAWKDKLPLIFAAGAGLFGLFCLIIYTRSRKGDKTEDESEPDDNRGEAEGPVISNYNSYSHSVSGSFPPSEEPTRNCHELKKLVSSLDEDDQDLILNSLRALGNLAAFRDLHRFIITGLPQVIRLLQCGKEEIQIEASNLVNNLALNEDNQTSLSRVVPVLLNEMKFRRKRSSRFILAASRALTNLALFDDNHKYFLPCLTVLAENLESVEDNIKVQILKVLVNLSANKRTTETCLEADAQMISIVSPYVTPEEDERLLLRASKCIANVLLGLHDRLEYHGHPQVYAPEFVNQTLHGNLERLVAHRNEDIRGNAIRALFSLRPAVMNGKSARLSDVDMVEVLKL